MWDWTTNLSVLAFVISSIVLWRQEFGRAVIRCTVGPKIWIYQEESALSNKMLARIILAVTFTNESPRGGTIEKLVLSWRKIGQKEATLVGWFYDVDIAEVDLNNPNIVAKRMMTGNPFHIPAKQSVTKFLLFDLNQDEDSIIAGPRLGLGDWEIRILGWSVSRYLFDISSIDRITFSAFHLGIFANQRRNKDMVSNIFNLNDRVESIETTSGSLCSHYKPINVIERKI